MHLKCSVQAPEGLDTEEGMIKDAAKDEPQVQTLSTHESFIPENCLHDHDI